MWYGRVLILLGIVNGGLGLKLSSDSPAYSRAGTIVYSVLAGIMGAVVIGLVILGGAKKVGQKKTEG